MSDSEQSSAPPARKSVKMPLIIGLCLACAGGGGGFFAVQAGLIPGMQASAPHEAANDAKTAAADPAAPAGEIAAMPDVAYVPVEPLVISLGDGANGAHLRFRAQLEVASAREQEVAALMPRIVDVLNTYLRALETPDLADSAALTRLRAQMLRRVQIVTGGGRVRDLLIMEFVLN